MSDLEPGHVHQLRAAVGWLELGSPREALAELDRLPAELRGHPDCLRVLWEIQAREKNWDAALVTAVTLHAARPREADSAIKFAFALHELKRTQEAWDALAIAEKEFPEESTIAYNLACYACQLGQHEEALRRLARAFKLGGKDAIKAMALKDVDLQPLWAQIKEL